MNHTARLLPPAVAAVTLRHPGAFELRLLYARPLLFLSSPAAAEVVADAATVGFRPAVTVSGWVLPL